MKFVVNTTYLTLGKEQSSVLSFVLPLLVLASNADDYIFSNLLDNDSVSMTSYWTFLQLCGTMFGRRGRPLTGDHPIETLFEWWLGCVPSSMWLRTRTSLSAYQFCLKWSHFCSSFCAPPSGVLATWLNGLLLFCLFWGVKQVPEPE